MRKLLLADLLSPASVRARAALEPASPTSSAKAATGCPDRWSNTIKKAFALAAALVAALTLSAMAALAQPGKQDVRSDRPTKVRDLSLELVGQVTNSPPGVSPATSIQYGYVAYLRGLPIFSADTQNETTALFTFYTQTTTVRVIANGPLRVISREGTMTIYRDLSANGNFSSPDTFRDGTPVLVAGLRQQVIVDSITGGFSALNLNTIMSTSPFPAGDGQLQLGDVGQRFKTILNGHLSSPAPSAYMAGYTLNAPDSSKHLGGK